MNTQRTSGGSVTPALPRPTVRRKRVLVPPSPVEWSDPEEDNPDSCVYFLYSAGKIKICQFTGGRATERKFHESFKANRLHGEWFAISEEMRWLISQHGAGLAEAEADFKKWLMEQKP